MDDGRLNNMPLIKAGTRAGIVGMPPFSLIEELRNQKAVIFDLDEPIVKKNMEDAQPFLPRVYCAVLRTVVLNSINLNLDIIFIDVGPGKCDCALHVATILAHYLDIPVIKTTNLDNKPFGTPLCRTEMPLLEKMEKITLGVKNSRINEIDNSPSCRPDAGFWGVPPRDFSLLKLFPSTTNIYGWTRCMENKTPADLELESYFNPGIPTIFFAQSFCAKTALAKLLADCHPRGLYVDADVTAGSSVKAKIQAFLELSGVKL